VGMVKDQNVVTRRGMVFDSDLDTGISQAMCNQMDL